MSGGSLLTVLLTALSLLVTVMKLISQMRSGISFGSRNFFRSMLLYHSKIYGEYRNINTQIQNHLWRIFPRRGSILSFIQNLVFPSLIIVFGIILFVNSLPHQTCQEVHGNFSYSNNMSNMTLSLTFFNSSIIHRLDINDIHCSANFLIKINASCNFTVCSSNDSSNNSASDESFSSLMYSFKFSLKIFVAFLAEILWILMFSRVPLITEGRWIEVLKKTELVTESVSYLMITYSLSSVIVLICAYRYKLYNLPTNMLLAFGVYTILGLLILGYLIVDINNTALRILWKAEVPRFAYRLPYLIVKTKTGNIYYGQLYDPLDSKVLVLRKSKLMHGEQIVENKENKSDLIPWTPWESAGDYWIIPWKDIESIKIVEEGLYESVSTGNNEPPLKLESSNQKPFWKKVKEGWKCAWDIVIKKIVVIGAIGLLVYLLYLFRNSLREVLKKIVVWCSHSYCKEILEALLILLIIVVILVGGWMLYEYCSSHRR